MKENLRVTNVRLTEEGEIELEVTTKYIIDPMSLIANLEITQDKNKRNQMKSSVNSKQDEGIGIKINKPYKNIWEEVMQRGALSGNFPTVKYTRMTPEEVSEYIKNTYEK